MAAPGYTPVVITKVTPSASNGGSNGSFDSAGSSLGGSASGAQGSSSLNAQQSAQYLSGDKVGVAGHNIVTHSTKNFNPNVNVVMNKKSSQKPLVPGE